jgi:hypothetical protein
MALDVEDVVDEVGVIAPQGLRCAPELAELIEACDETIPFEVCDALAPAAYAPAASAKRRSSNSRMASSITSTWLASEDRRLPLGGPQRCTERPIVESIKRQPTRFIFG